MNENAKYLLVEEDYDNVNTQFHNQYDTTKEFKLQIDSFLRHLPTQGSILNIGGTLAECMYFLENGFSVTNIDISKTMLDHITRHDQRVKVIKANIRDFSGQKFDGIWACRSLIHIPPTDLGKVLANISNLIDPNGLAGMTLFTTAEGNFTEQQVPEPNSNKEGITYYRTLYSKEYLATAIKGAGLKIIKSEDCFDMDSEEAVYIEAIIENAGKREVN